MENMRPLSSGQDTVLSWRTGALECRVVAAAGDYVLLRPEVPVDPAFAPRGAASLTYLDGMVPMGWDGDVQPGGEFGELRFQVTDPDRTADRRSSVRVPIFAAVRIVDVDATVHSGHLLDVSAGGMRFRHPGRFEEGAMLRVLCALSEELVIDSDAIVRAAQQGVTSVEFTHMRCASRDTIARWTVGLLRQGLAVPI